MYDEDEGGSWELGVRSWEWVDSSLWRFNWVY